MAGNENEEPKKKMHWTKTPEGREKMSKALRKFHRKKKNGTHTQKHAAPKVPSKPSSKNTHVKNIIPQDTFAYALGYIECWIETFAKSAGLPSETFATELGKVLQHKNSR